MRPFPSLKGGDRLELSVRHGDTDERGDLRPGGERAEIGDEVRYAFMDRCNELSASRSVGARADPDGFTAPLTRCVPRLSSHEREQPGGTEAIQENPHRGAGFSLVAPTGVDPVTFRFSVERSTN